MRCSPPAASRTTRASMPVFGTSHPCIRMRRRGGNATSHGKVVSERPDGSRSLRRIGCFPTDRHSPNEPSAPRSLPRHRLPIGPTMNTRTIGLRPARVCHCSASKAVGHTRRPPKDCRSSAGDAGRVVASPPRPRLPREVGRREEERSAWTNRPCPPRPAAVSSPVVVGRQGFTLTANSG